MTSSALQRRAAKSKTIAPRPHFLASDQPAVLRRIREPGVNLCLWTRAADPRAAVAVRALLSARDPLALDLAAPTPARLAAGLLEVIRRPSATGRAGARHLAEDIVALAAHFSAVAETRHPRVRLTRVEDDCCALFHADTLRVRMLCTYAGDGTQWLENDNVRRDQLGSQGRTLDEATRAIVVDLAAIRTIPAWHVAALKGRAWPGEEDNAIVHRSAPVAERSAHRLVLCLDLPAACSC